MNKLYRRYYTVLLFVLNAGLLTGQTVAKAPAAKDLIADLRKALATQAGALNDQRLSPARYPDQLEGFVAQGRFAEAEQLLLQLRTNLPAGNEKTSELIEQLLASVRAQMAEIVAKQDAAYDAVVADFIAKFETKAPAADFDALLMRLAAISPVGSYNSPAGQKVEMLRNFITRWQDYLFQSARGNFEQAVQSLNDLVQQSVRLAIIPRSRLAALAAEGGVRPSGTSDVVGARLEAFYKELADTIETAKGAADFDAILAEISKPQLAEASAYRSGNPFEVLRRLTVRWQDYFSQLEAGKAQAAQSVLSELANGNNSGFEKFYPRSRILGRLNGTGYSGATATMSDAMVAPGELTLANLDKFAGQVMVRQNVLGLTPGMEGLPGETDSLQRATQQLRAGSLHTAAKQLRPSGLTNHTGEYAGPLQQLRTEITLSLMTALVQAPAELQPGKQDSAETYFKRLSEYGKKQKNWEFMERLFSAVTELQLGDCLSSAEVLGYQQFFTGLRQEKAGLWELAVRAYIAALSISDASLPVDEIGGRLRQIKTDHPDDYLRGSNTPNPAQFRSQPSMTDPRFYSFPTRPQMPPADSAAVPKPLESPVSPRPTK